MNQWPKPAKSIRPQNPSVGHVEKLYESREIDTLDAEALWGRFHCRPKVTGP